MAITEPRAMNEKGIGPTRKSWRENLTGAEAFLILLCAIVVCGVTSAIVIGLQ